MKKLIAIIALIALLPIALSMAIEAAEAETIETIQPVIEIVEEIQTVNETINSVPIVSEPVKETIEQAETPVVVETRIEVSAVSPVKETETIVVELTSAVEEKPIIQETQTIIPNTGINFSPIEPVTPLGGLSPPTAIREVCFHTGSRSMGFWKHQFNVATGGNGEAQIDAQTLLNWLPENLFGMNITTLQQGYDLLWPEQPASMQARAKQQCFATLMNKHWAPLNDYDFVDTNFDGTLNMWFWRAWNKINNFYNDGEFQKAKDFCESINLQDE